MYSRGVQLVGPVHPDVDEPGGDLAEPRPVAGRVGHDERDAVSPEDFVAPVVDEGRRAALPARAGAADPPRPPCMPCRRAARRARRPARRPRCSCAGAGRGTHRAPRGRSDAWPAAARARTQLLAEGEDARGEEVRQGAPRVPQAEHVRDVPGALHREHEPRRCFGAPPEVALRPLQRVERPIELDAAQVLRGELKLPPLGQTGRVEDTAPGRVPPAGDADPDQ